MEYSQGLNIDCRPWIRFVGPAYSTPSLEESPAAPAATMAPAPMAPLNPPPEMLSEPSVPRRFFRVPRAPQGT